MAAEAFEAYLMGGGDEISDERREEVTGEIRRMQPLVGRLELDENEELVVYIDDEQRAVTPLVGPLRVPWVATPYF